MKKVNLTLSRLAALSAFGFAFAGGCETDPAKTGTTSTSTSTLGAPGAAGANGLTVDQVKDMIAKHPDVAAAAAAKVTSDDLLPLLADPKVKGALATTIADHTELKAWTAVKDKVEKLATKETELLALAGLDNAKIAAIASGEQKALEDLRDAFPASAANTEAKLVALAKLIAPTYRGVITSITAVNAAASTGKIGVKTVGDYFILHNTLLGTKELYKCILATTGAALTGALKLVNVDGAVPGALVDLV